MPANYDNLNGLNLANVKQAFDTALNIIQGLDEIPFKAGAWFKFKYLQDSFKKFFGQHNHTHLTAFRNQVMRLTETAETTIGILFLSRRDSLLPQYQGIDLECVHAASDIENKVILIGERFLSSDKKTQALTIFHELTHIICNTEDYDFDASKPQAAFIEFAQNSPEKAINCAYSFEQFASENYEKLLMFAEQARRSEAPITSSPFTASLPWRECEEIDIYASTESDDSCSMG